MEYINEGLSFPRNRDLNGRVIFVFKSKLHFKGMRDHQELLKIFVYWMDRIQRFVYIVGDLLIYLILISDFRENTYEPITIFFDLAETGVANLDLEYTKSVINILKYYYPNSVGSILIYEQPWILGGKIINNRRKTKKNLICLFFNILYIAAIKIMKALLPPKAVQALKSVSSKTITEYISEENLLKDWGGPDDFVFQFVPENMSTKLDAPATPSCMKKVIHFRFYI